MTLQKPLFDFNIYYSFWRSYHRVREGKNVTLRFLELIQKWVFLSQVATISKNQSLADPLCFVCTMKCLHPKVVSKAVHLEPIILFRSTGFFLWYPPLPRLPFPSHLSQATLPLPLQILHGSWGYRTSKGLTNNPSPAPLFSEDLCLETPICFFRFLCSNIILPLG